MVGRALPAYRLWGYVGSYFGFATLALALRRPPGSAEPEATRPENRSAKAPVKDRQRPSGPRQECVIDGSRRTSTQIPNRRPRCGMCRRAPAAPMSGPHRELELREFCCPDCATLLELEVCRTDEESLWSLSLS